MERLVIYPLEWKLARRMSRKCSVLLPIFVVLIFSVDTFSQCRYDWQQEAFPIFGSRTPSPEVNMSDENKIRISRACDKLFKDFIDTALRPDPNYWRDDRPRNCEALSPVGRTGESLNSRRYTQYYRPSQHPRSFRGIDVERWYSLFDCPTRQAIRLLEKRNIWIPSGLIVYRIPKPGRNYQSPTIIPRTGAWKPIGHVIIPEFDDREFLSYRFPEGLGIQGVILSSIGEIIHERKAGEFYYTLGGKKPRNAEEVSSRAGDSAYHFVADVFAGWVLGKTYPPAVWEEYRSYRGPVYRGMPR